MAGIQEVLAALEGQKSPFVNLLEGVSSGFANAQQNRFENVKQLLALEEYRQKQEYRAQQNRLIQQKLGNAAENRTQQDKRTMVTPSTSPDPSLRLGQKAMEEETITYGPEGISLSVKTKAPKEPEWETKVYQDRVTGENRQGKVNKSTGEWITSPNDPLAQSQPKEQVSPEDRETQKLMAKRKVNQPIERRNLENAFSNFDRMISEAKDIQNHPGLEYATGFSGSIAKLHKGSAGYNALARINTLKSKTGFSVLQDMRANSPTGGALGQVSDRENQMLQENISSLDTGQSAEDFKASLQRVIDYAEGAKKRLKQAYDETYGDIAPRKSAGSPSGENMGGITGPKKIGRFHVAVEE